MASKGRDEDLLIEDELTAAFLSDEDVVQDANGGADASSASDPQPGTDEWDEEEAVPGQLAVDVYETKEKLVVKARTAGVNRSELDVSISDNTLSIRGTLLANE